MPTYAQIVGGQALNICIGADLTSALATTYAPGFQGAGGTSWIEIPDGTVEGATTTDNVSFTAPAATLLPPQVLSKTSFNLLCFAALGGGAPGIAAFQAIIDAATAAGGAPRGLVTHYTGADSFVLSDVEGFFAILVGANCMQQTQANAVIAAWPT